MKRLFIAFAVAFAASITAAAQTDAVTAYLTRAKSLTGAVKLEKATLRGNIEDDYMLGGVVAEIFAPDAAIVVGACDGVPSIATVGSIAIQGVSGDDQEFAEIAKIGMQVYDLVWDCGGRELHSVAVADAAGVVYDNIGTRCLTFKAKEGSVVSPDKSKGKYVYASKGVSIMISDVCMNYCGSLLANCFAGYKGKRISDCKSVCLYSVGKKGFALKDESSSKIVSGGLVGKDSTVSSVWESKVSTPNLVVKVAGRTLTVPGASYTEKGSFTLTPDDAIRSAKPARGLEF